MNVSVTIADVVDLCTDSFLKTNVLIFSAGNHLRGVGRAGCMNVCIDEALMFSLFCEIRSTRAKALQHISGFSLMQPGCKAYPLSRVNIWYIASSCTANIRCVKTWGQDRNDSRQMGCEKVSHYNSGLCRVFGVFLLSLWHFLVPDEPVYVDFSPHASCL